MSQMQPRVPQDHHTLIRGARIWTGEDARASAFTGDVLVGGNTILLVGKVKDSVLEGLASVEVLEAAGLTLIPGLVEGHGHLSFHDIVNITDPGDMPPEESVLHTACKSARDPKRLL